MAELIDIVDEHDKVIGAAPRKGIHSTRLKHRAAHIFIIDGKSRIWIEKRAEHCDTYPGYHNSSAAGHVSQGESYEQAAKREVEEELGFKDITLRMLHKLQASEETSNEFVAFFVGQTDQKPTIHSDTAELILLDVEEIKRMIKNGAKFTPVFKLLFDYYLRTTAK